LKRKKDREEVEKGIRLWNAKREERLGSMCASYSHSILITLRVKLTNI
jgi:hypothetical protein